MLDYCPACYVIYVLKTLFSLSIHFRKANLINNTESCYGTYSLLQPYVQQRCLLK